jgi:class 3 adenylate cyclase
MRCSKCGSDNREGRKFCTSCGTPLVSSCPKCHVAIQPGERFCGECGAAIDSSGLSRSAPPQELLRFKDAVPPTEVTDGERKTVTALFGDMKGSTELMEGMDPEEARAIIDPALKLMIDAVGRYDSYIVQSTGDGIFALFGAPVAHEDHPQRALYAAVRMQEELRRYGVKLQQEGQAPLEIRIGVNSWISR